MAIENFVGMLTSFVVGVVSGIAGYRYLATRNLLPAIQMANKIPKKILKEDMKMVIAVRTDLDMGKGKIAAQCCHASVGCYKQAAKKFPQYLETWEYQGQRKIVVKVDGGEEGLEELANAAKLRGLPAKIIHDAGRTQIASGTATVVGVGPGPENLVTEVTGHLKLF